MGAGLDQCLRQGRIGDIGPGEQKPIVCQLAAQVQRLKQIFAGKRLRRQLDRRAVLSHRLGRLWTNRGDFHACSDERLRVYMYARERIEETSHAVDAGENQPVVAGYILRRGIERACVRRRAHGDYRDGQDVCAQRFERRD